MARLSSLLKDIADAIRKKKGSTKLIKPQDFATEISGIEGDGGITQRVSYLRRTNSGYIDTGIPGANSNLTIIARFAFTTLPTGYWHLIHAYENESTNATRIFVNSNKNVLGSLNSIASSSAVVAQTLFTGVIYTAKLSPTSITNFSITSNGVSGSKGRTSGGALSEDLFIFANGTDAVDIELYSLQILDNGVLVRDFIPHYQDGEFGLWDVVNGRFYGNSGSGTFGGQILDING